MTIQALQIQQVLRKPYRKVKPNPQAIADFRAGVMALLARCEAKQSEEFHKNLLRDFLSKTYYGDRYFMNTKDQSDLVIHNGNHAERTVGVIFETKKPTQKLSAEMPSLDNLNTKALQQLVLYFLRERILHKNLEIKHLIVTNIYEWFIFDGKIFEDLFYSDKAFIQPKLITSIFDKILTSKKKLLKLIQVNENR